MEYTVLVFKYIEFDKNWDRVVTSQATFESQNDPSQILVVTEDANAAKTTYWFQLSKGRFVDVSWSTNYVIIPDRCVKKDKGDTTKCRK